MPLVHFTAFVITSLIVFLAILGVALRGRTDRPKPVAVAAVAFVVVVIGMVFAKWGATHGLPWPLYYGLPAAMTVFLPPLYFRMHGREAVEYLVMASLSAPAIHATFSLLLGWNEYMPFIHVPSLKSLGLLP